MPFERLRVALLQGGVAPRHVRRYLAELGEHLDDLTAQQRSAGYDAGDAMIRARARLGEDRELAAAMLAQPRMKSWTARAPWVVFVIAPPFAAAISVMVPTLVLVLLGHALHLLGGHAATPPLWFGYLANVIVNASNLLMVPATAALFIIVAARQRLRLYWPLIATAIMLMLFVHAQVQLATPGHPGNSLGVGMAPIFFTNAWHDILLQWPMVAAQYALTLLPALWLLRRDGLRHS